MKATAAVPASYGQRCQRALRAADAGVKPFAATRLMHVRNFALSRRGLSAFALSKRVLSTAEARSMLRMARASKSPICVSRKDLGAPYEKRARERHEGLHCVNAETLDG